MGNLEKCIKEKNRKLKLKTDAKKFERKNDIGSIKIDSFVDERLASSSSRIIRE